MVKNHRGGPHSGPPSSLHLHRGDAVRVGQFTVHAGGIKNLRPQDFREINPDVVIPLLGDFPIPTDFRAEILEATLQDFGGVPPNWEEILEQVIERLESGKKVLAFCFAGHGRTGTLLASLVSLLENDVSDPIATVRERYCSHAVETLLQAEAVFRLRNRPLPARWRRIFT